MILDAIILIILILPMAIGMHRGLMYMMINVLSWAAAFAAAAVLSRPLAGVIENGSIGSMLSESISEKFGASADSIETAADGLPDIISGGLRITAESASDIFSELITSMIISVISFLIIIFIVKLILRIVLKSLANRDRGSLLSKADKLAGFAAGAAEGIFFVFLFLMLLIPAVNLGGGNVAAGIVNSLDSSIFAGTLYDNNLLLLVTGGIFS